MTKMMATMMTMMQKMMMEMDGDLDDDDDDGNDDDDYEKQEGVRTMTIMGEVGLHLVHGAPPQLFGEAATKEPSGRRVYARRTYAAPTILPQAFLEQALFGTLSCSRAGDSPRIRRGGVNCNSQYIRFYTCRTGELLGAERCVRETW